jgi:hypothetical protein
MGKWKRHALEQTVKKPPEVDVMLAAERIRLRERPAEEHGGRFDFGQGRFGGGAQGKQPSPPTDERSVQAEDGSCYRQV